MSALRVVIASWLWLKNEFVLLLQFVFVRRPSVEDALWDEVRRLTTPPLGGERSDI